MWRFCKFYLWVKRFAVSQIADRQQVVKAVHAEKIEEHEKQEDCSARPELMSTQDKEFKVKEAKANT